AADTELDVKSGDALPDASRVPVRSASAALDDPVRVTLYERFAHPVALVTGVVVTPYPGMVDEYAVL
ncbi:MAG: hypothetical protein M3N47_12040, partial [Chloroflexota bacterium]|nr:hypothetical protein [Chloroflexota bacterium]